MYVVILYINKVPQEGNLENNHVFISNSKTNKQKNQSSSNHQKGN